ncbi:MAG: hypothetical protein KC503_08750 [Myxococcales bacterium]|nr:hypothetical protein [Myxococcales bacterium]
MLIALCLSLLACGETPTPTLGRVARAATSSCKPGFDCCFEALSQSLAGATPDPSLISDLGNNDPAVWFKSGGSENHAVACRVAKYHVDNDPAWLTRWLELQLQPGAPHFLNRETFSNTYTSLVIGGAIAALRRAQAQGHATLAAHAASWLGAYWTYLALAATEPALQRTTTYSRYGTDSQTVSWGWGYNIGVVGSRCYVNGYGGTAPSAGGPGLQSILLAVALEHPSRAFKSGLIGGYYSGLRVALQALGYKLDAKGRVDLASRSVPPEQVGLTAAWRAQLRAFIQGGGASGASALLARVAGLTLRCPQTLLRTQAGVISWHGESTGTTSPCGDVKGGPWAIARALAASGSSDWVTRSSDKWGNGDRGSVTRVGDTICARSSTLPALCLDIPSGALRYEIVLGPQGARCVAGSCATSGGGDGGGDSSGGSDASTPDLGADSTAPATSDAVTPARDNNHDHDATTSTDAHASNTQPSSGGCQIGKEPLAPPPPLLLLGVTLCVVSAWNRRRSSPQ